MTGNNFDDGLFVSGNPVLTGTTEDLGKWEDGSAGKIYYTGGFVGVSNDNPNFNLHVSGDVKIENSLKVGSAFDLSQNGNLSNNTPNIGDAIKWDGSKWIPGFVSSNNGGGGGVSVPSPFVRNLTSGQSIHAISFGQTFNSIPGIATDLETNGEGGIIPYTISGVSTTGYHAVFTAPIPNDFYRIHTVFGGAGSQSSDLWETGDNSSIYYNNGDVSIQRNFNIGGNLNVNGTTTTINTQTVEIEDHNLVIAANTGYDQLTSEYPGAGGAYAGILWGTGDAGSASPVSLTYQTNKGFAFEGGDVGIGTANPSAKLEVKGSSQGVALFKSDSTAEGAVSFIAIESPSATSNGRTRIGADGDDLFFNTSNGATSPNTSVERMRIDTSGNVGIGTTSPNNLLHVKRNTTDNAYAIIENTTVGNAGINLKNASGDWNIVANADLRFIDNAVGDRMCIDSNGNVGIGTTSPASGVNLHLSSENDDDHYAVTRFTADTKSFDVGVGGSNVPIEALRNKFYIYDSSAGSASSSDGIKLVVNSDGNVGIGTANPDDKLEINANSENTGITIRNTSGGTPARITLVNNEGDGQIDTNNGLLRFGNSTVEDMVIDSDGNVGIGTANPSDKLSLPENSGITWVRADNTDESSIANNEDDLIIKSSRGTGSIILDTNTVGIGTTTPQSKLDVVDNSGKCSTRIWSIADDVIGGTNMQGAWTEYGIKHGRGADNVFFTADDTPDYSFNIGVDAETTGSAGEVPKFKLGYSANSWNAPADSDVTIMTLQPDGNVGIGTTDPGYQLELQKAGGGFLSFKTTDTDIKNPDVLGVIQFAADDATTAGLDIGAKIVATATDNFQSAGSNVDAPTRLDFYTQNNSNDDVFSTVGATLSLGGDDQRAVFRGYVGIGTTSPSSKLTVQGDEGTNTYPIQILGSNTDKNRIAGILDTHVASTGRSAGALALHESSTTTGVFLSAYPNQDSYINNGGNVGIGTTDPSGPLHIWDTTANQINLTRAIDIRGSSGASAEIHGGALVDTIPSMGGAIGFTLKDSDGEGVGTNTEGAIYFKVKDSGGNLTQRMYINSNGNVGIGTTSSNTNRLQVMAGVNTQPLFVGSDSGSVCTMNRDTTDGHVLRFEKNGVLVGHISTNSNSLPSDRNFKRNISDLELGLDFVNKLKPSVYNYKIDDEDSPVHYGLIAQDVESALEECGVEKNSSLMLQHSPTEKEEESDYSLDYGKLVPVLTKAIQEQQTIIEDLKAQNESLIHRIEILENK